MSSSAGSAGADEPRPVIPVICGPTASGKSDLAMWLAGRHPVEIISADSRQVYRGFDVGTAKPSAADRARVPHHGIDVADPLDRYSAAEWSAMALDAIAGALARQRIPLVVGGTGFYIASLVRPLWEQPAMDPQHRTAVQAFLEGLPADELRRWCMALDPARAHLGRAQRMRAIEVALITGWRLSEMHVNRARSPVLEARYLLVDPGTELHARIATRASAMLDGGWIDEVRRLVAAVAPDAPAWNATGYDLVRRHVEGQLGRQEMLERIVIDTRQYAKRQRTWFRHQLEPERVTRLNPLAAGWQEQVEAWMRNCSAGSREPNAGNRP